MRFWRELHRDRHECRQGRPDADGRSRDRIRTRLGNSDGLTGPSLPSYSFAHRETKLCPKAGELYIVSHAFNRVRLDQRHEPLAAAFDKYAPRYEGDDEYDVRTMFAHMKESQP